METNSSNITNGSTSDKNCPYGYCVEDTIYRKVVGTLIFLIVWPFIVQDVKYFPLGRPAAALLGATLMVVFTITPREQVYRVLGNQGNIQTICLLVGMMSLSYYYDREGLLHIITLWIFGKGKLFRHVLWKVCILSAILSALTNDATCVVVTPLLLKKQKRAGNEIASLLLSIATSANIGSASTFFGNPQNAYIASNTGLSLLIFFITSLPAAIIGLVINTTLLYVIYYKVVFGISARSTLMVERITTHPAPAGSLAEERLEQSMQYDKSHNPLQSSEIAAERNSMYKTENSFHGEQFSRSSSSRSLSTWHGEVRDREQPTPREINVEPEEQHYGATGFSASLPNLALTIQHNSQGKRSHNEINRRNSTLSPTHEREERVDTNNIKKRRWNVWLIIITTLLIGLLAVPPLRTVKFNLGLVPFGAAVFTMLVDTILNCKCAQDVMIQVDWPVILMFFGLFVWLVGFENTNLPNQAFDKMREYMNLSTISGVLLFTVFVIVGSNILSNVPLVILFI